jgi:hypothetical protein
MHSTVIPDLCGSHPSYLTSAIHRADVAMTGW